MVAVDTLSLIDNAGIVEVSLGLQVEAGDSVIAVMFGVVQSVLMLGVVQSVARVRVGVHTDVLVMVVGLVVVGLVVVLCGRLNLFLHLLRSLSRSSC